MFIPGRLATGKYGNDDDGPEDRAVRAGTLATWGL